MISGKLWELTRMLELTPTKKFKKNLKKFKHQIKVIQALNEVIRLLRQKKILPKKYANHPLDN